MTCMTVGCFVFRVNATSISIFPHSFIFVFKKFWIRWALMVRRISLSETILYPGRELGFEAFSDFDPAPFVTVYFTGVGVPWIFFFLPLKRVFCEVLFHLGRPLLLMAGDVCAAVAGGTGSSTGVISRLLMFDVWCVRRAKWGWWLKFFRWLSLANFDKKLTRPLRAINAQRMSYMRSKNDVKKHTKKIC